MLLWSFAKRQATRENLERGGYLPPSPLFDRYNHPPRHLRHPLLGSPRSKGAFTTADYLRHLHEATYAAKILDTVKPLAMAGDVQSLMQSPESVATALAILSAPLDVIFAQKDLNVLGASPPLAEDGVMTSSTAEAIRGIQARFGQPESGAIDPATAATIRYAVGCIHAQDRAIAGV
jgi:hypothetical protein